MKVRYIIALAVCILFVAVWYFRDNGFSSRKDAAALFVPQDTVIFVEQKEIGTLIENVKISRLGKALANMDFLQIGKDVGLSLADQSTLQKTLQIFKDLLDDKLFREFCGKTVALALLPTEPFQITEGSALSPVQGLLITKPKHKAEILEIVSTVFTGSVQQSEILHKGITIKKILFEDTTVFVATIDGYFLFSLNEQTIRQSLDVSRSAERSLAKNTTYLKLINNFHKPEFMIFCSLVGLRQQLEKLAQQDSSGLQKEFIEQLAATKGLTHSAYGIWKDKGLLRDSSITLVDPVKLDPFFAQLLAIAPEHNDTLRLVPENLVTYYWSNTLALSSMWKMYAEMNNIDTPELATFKAVVKKSTGKEITEVLALINGGASLFIKKGDPKAFIPLPYFAVFLKLNDRYAGEEIMRHILAEYAVPFQSHTYKQVTYSSYDLTLQGGLQALYGFDDNFLFFSNSSEIIKDIIDTKASGKGLQTGETYAKMNLDLAEGNNSVCFIRIADMLGGTKDLLVWGSAMLAMQNQETAEKSRIILERIINPLLDGLTMFSTITTRGRLAKDQIIVESVISLDPVLESP